MRHGSYSFETIPLNGSFVFTDYETTLFQRRDESPRWPALQVASRDNWAELEIVSACQGALHRRVATIEQWGTVSSLFGQNYANRRSDTVRWSAFSDGRRPLDVPDRDASSDWQLSPPPTRVVPVSAEGLTNGIRTARLGRGWTQEELASRVGVSRKTVNTVETGRFVPSVIVALKLARALETSVEQLFRPID